MKKLINLLLTVCICFTLLGCEADEFDYVGKYALLRKEDTTYLVVVWEFPNDEFQMKDCDVDITNIEEYMNDDYIGNGPGLVLNSLLGNVGYNRKHLQFFPVGIQEKDVNTIIRKNISIYLNVTDQNDTAYKVKLKYDKTIKE